MLVDARALAALLLGCRWVRGLHTGPHDAILTHPDTDNDSAGGGPVHGVLVLPHMIVLGLVVGPRIDHGLLAARVRARLARDAPGVPVSLSLIRSAERDPGPPAREPGSVQRPA
ncbi:MAG: hypothetical protein L0I76_33410 [Pseudonocardia sp.]|nr:hypothetical protein [Pseudonocardia sp.]